MSDRSADWFAQAERAPAGEHLRRAARTLDRYYIPARYPNGYAEGKPGDYIATEDAENATGWADADILVILAHTDVPILDRHARFSPHFADLGLPVEFFVYSRDEVASRPTSIAERAMAAGIDLLDPGRPGSHSG